jgi:hypothetical protein
LLVYFGEKSLKTKRNFLSTIILAILTMPIALPLLAQPTSAETLEEPELLTYRNKWQWIKTDSINVIFPAGGKKPMFLWWYANDTSNVYVVKCKGLVEFMTYDCPYYKRVCAATELNMQNMLNATFFGPNQHRVQEMARNRIRQRLMQLADYFPDLHRAFLPFSGCEWNLTGPVEVARGDVQYLSFNFTLVRVPFSNLKFAENNVIIRCRFYYTPATEDVEGLYSYSVEAGELKMDLIVSNWKWNIDVIQPLLGDLAENGIEVPAEKAGLALWINLASISLEQIDLAEEDLQTGNGQVETMSMTQNMYVEGAQVGVTQNMTQRVGEMERPTTATARIRERYKLRLGEPEATLAGFFKYVPQALVRDGDDVTVVDVAASYIPAGHHMRLFLAYPYFGNSTLEHDPSLGLESLPTLVTPMLLLLVVGSASVITIAVLAVRWKRKTVNIVGAQ